MGRLARSVLLIGSIGLAATAVWAERPSLSGLEVEMERTRAAMCALAEFEGATYRPFFCEPACRDCLTAGEIGQFASFQTVTCDEGPAFEFVVEGSSTFGSCTVAGCSSGFCSGSLGGSCESTPCPAGESCTVNPFGPDFCVRPCTADAQCSGLEPNFCDGTSGVACTQASDCALGETCDLGTCRRSCSSGCNPTTAVSLLNVKGPDSPEPALCGPDAYNSADALACLSEVEATYGITCSTICGNGVLQTGEQCDDGNTQSGDGCSASCQTE